MSPGIFILVFPFVVQYQMVYAPRPGETLIKVLKENDLGNPKQLDTTPQGQLKKFVTEFFEYQTAASTKRNIPWKDVGLIVPKCYNVYFGSVTLSGKMQLTLHTDKEVIENFLPKEDFYLPLREETRLSAANFAGRRILAEIKGNFQKTTFIEEAGIEAREYTSIVEGLHEPFYFVAIALKLTNNKS